LISDGAALDLRPPARLGILCLMYLFLYERCTMNGVLVF
jgi:hypothetical protein